MLRRLPVVFLGVVALFMGPSTAARADTSTQLPFSAGPVWLAVDPTGQHVFVSGGPGNSSIVVLDFDGNIVKTITGEGGASQMAVNTATHTLYVALHDATAISEIDTTTLAETTRFSTGAFAEPSSLVIGGGKLWFSCTDSGNGCVASANLNGTGITQQSLGGIGQTTALATGGAGHNLLAVGDTGGSPSTVAVYDISGATPSLVSGPTHPDGDCSGLNDLALDPSGANVLLACPFPYYVESFATSNLLPSAEYPTAISNFPLAAAVTADGKFVAGGTSTATGSGNNVFVFPVGETTPVRVWAIGNSSIVPHALAFSPNASRLFAVTNSASGLEFDVLDQPTVAPGPPPPPPGELPFSAYTGGLHAWLAVDAPGQHVFVSGGPGNSSIFVLDFDGNIVKTITGEGGASQMALDTATHTLYVALHDATAISEIDTTTLTETTRFSTAPFADPSSLVIGGGKLWFSCTDNGNGCIASANLDGTGMASANLQYIAGQADVTALAVGGSGNDLLAEGIRFSDPSPVAVYDISQDPPSLVSSTAHGCDAGMRDLILDPAGANLLLACGVPHSVVALSTNDLLPTAEYPSGSLPNAAAVSADGAYVAAGGGFPSMSIAVYPAGGTTPLRTWIVPTNDDEQAHYLAFSPDETKVFAVVASNGQYFINVLAFRPPNDDFAHAIVLSGEDATRTDDTSVDAGLEPGEPTQVAGAAAGASIWYRWTAPATGRVSVDTGFSDFDTLLAVYTGSAVGSLSEVASNDDAGADYLTGTVAFDATAGTTYQIRVDGLQGDTGTVDLHLLETEGSAPPNDSFANAVQLTGLSAERTGDTNAGASLETGEPSVMDDAPAGRSIWYRWTPAESGSLSLDTAGSDFDTLLGVYTGSTVADLTEVAVNDDAASDLTSAVVTDVDAGTTYWIRVDGFGGETGTVSLHLAEAVTPDAPTGVSATPGSGQATVSWSAPAFQGSSPITGYELTAYVGGVEDGSADIPVEDGTTVTIVGLTNGTTYTFRIAAFNDAGIGPQSAESNPVTPVNPPPSPVAPTNSAGPTITGTPKPGQTLTAAPGTWSGTAPITYTYQWAACNATGTVCVAVPGETTSTYVVTSADGGSALRVIVTASNLAGSATALSAVTAVVPKPPAPCLVPRLEGKTLTKARSLLHRAHCTLGAVSHAHSKLRRGLIVSQRPHAHASRSHGAKVSVVVSKGPRR